MQSQNLYHFRLKSMKAEYSRVVYVPTSGKECSILDIILAIKKALRIKRSNILLQNWQTLRTYSDPAELVPACVGFLVLRVPFPPKKVRAPPAKLRWKAGMFRQKNGNFKF